MCSTVLFTDSYCLYFCSFIDEKPIYLFPVAPLQILIWPISVLFTTQQDVVAIFLEKGAAGCRQELKTFVMQCNMCVCDV
jgi:hypothetical protein